MVQASPAEVTSIPADDPTCFVVEDNFLECSFIKEALERQEYKVKSFSSAEEMLEALAPGDWGCLVTDIRLPAMSGIELVRRLKGDDILLDVVIVSGHADLSLAIEALDLRVSALLVKPVDAADVVAKVGEAIEAARARRDDRCAELRLRDTLDKMTEREKEVGLLVVEGLTSKQIARRLGLSPRTIEIYRHRVMEKTGAKSLPELTRLLARQELEAESVQS